MDKEHAEVCEFWDESSVYDCIFLFATSIYLIVSNWGHRNQRMFGEAFFIFLDSFPMIYPCDFEEVESFC